MKDGEYKKAEDAILIDEVEANSKEEACNIVLNSEEHKDKVFDKLVAREIVT
ncbi:MAG: hypothetical protein ACOCUR_03005 [Nanoarchaeota archaeon]